MTILRGHDLLVAAEAVARIAHHGQVRVGGEPYINHPRRVADHLWTVGPETEAAGWLHDVVEDSAITLDQLEAAGFPKVVLNAVDSVTRREGETYFAMIERACSDPIGRVVKLADNADNSSEESMMHLPEKRRVSQMKRYTKARRLLMGDDA